MDMIQEALDLYMTSKMWSKLINMFILLKCSSKLTLQICLIASSYFSPAEIPIYLFLSQE